MELVLSLTTRYALRYFGIYLFAPLMFLGFVRGGGWAYVIPVVGFFLIPVLELVLPPSPRRRESPDFLDGLHDRLFDWALYLALPVQYFLLWTFLNRLAFDPPAAWEWLGMIWTMGIACGVFGINVGHELGHRYRWPEQVASYLLFTTALYNHMLLHHNRAHHAWVGTPRDPNTARPGESLYAFWARSIVSSYWSAWNVQARRLRRRGLGLLHFRNELLWWQPIQWTLLIAAFVYFGPRAGLSLVAAAAVGVLMLETINYIEHYGLVRKRLASGRFEKMGRRHAWNSDHPLGRALLFQVTRHSDHHLNPTKEYQRLANLDRSPQMPTGYPGMMLLATVPPLWFRVVGPRLEEVRRRRWG